jgi:hypothetical protein
MSGLPDDPKEYEAMKKKWLRDGARSAPPPAAVAPPPSIAETGTTSSTAKAPAPDQGTTGKAALEMDSATYKRERERRFGKTPSALGS